MLVQYLMAMFVSWAGSRLLTSKQQLVLGLVTAVPVWSPAARAAMHWLGGVALLLLVLRCEDFEGGVRASCARLLQSVGGGASVITFMPVALQPSNARLIR